ncbi:MAG: Fe-S cluster assembly protein HesB [Chlorobiaceae bacterium]|nr:Fe-S cluster assembly protein HesB [Chlorobiaceae bacterium]NTV60677.1 Fe-S cluster assembly protein HesB [Chlorobiaceae bacterium]
MHNIKINAVRLSLTDTLYSGQSFMWNYLYDNRNISAGILCDTPVLISTESTEEIEIICASSWMGEMPPEEFFPDYFSFDVDVRNAFPEKFTFRYPCVWEQLQKYFSLRILRQDPFEAMITFMCAQGIGMRIIRNQVSLLARTYGKRYDIMYRDRPLTLYGFPSPVLLAGCDPLELSICTNNNRTRARNIILASRAVAEGNVDFNALRDDNIPLEEVRRRLCELNGIGLKIADCIALFGLGRFDAFPVDTHVRQYLAEWFGSTAALRPLTPSTYLTLDAEARTIFNPALAGYAGHLLFHCWRKEVKKLRWF